MKNKNIIILLAITFIAGIVFAGGAFFAAKKAKSLIQKVGQKIEACRIANIPKAKEPLVICDFENQSDLVKWQLNNSSVELLPEHATSGKYGAKITIRPANGAAGVKMERFFEKSRKFTDWSRYEVLAFDIYNPGNEKDRIILQIKDKNGKRAKINLYLEPNTNNHIEIDIAKLWGSIKPNNIIQLNLILWDNRVPKVFYLDNLRLLPSAAFEKQNKSILGEEFLPKEGEQIYATGDYFAFDAAGWPQIPLLLKNNLTVNLKDLYFSGGIPFPKGQLHSLDNLELFDPQGNKVDFQAKIISKWPDQSTKWALLTFKSGLLAQEQRQFYLKQGNNVKPQPQTSLLKLNDNVDNILVSTGKIKFRVSKKGFYLFDALWLDKNNDGAFDDNEIVSQKADLVLMHRGKEYYSHFDNNCEISVEEQGPERACIRAKGWFISERGKKFCQFIIRIYAFVGSDYLKIQHTFVYTGYPENKYHYLYQGKRLPANETIEAVYIKTPLSLEDESKFSFEADDKVMQGDVNADIAFFQNKFNRYQVTKENNVINEGGKLDGWIDISTEGSGFAIGIKNFWQQFPKSFYIDRKNKQVLIYLWPREAGELDLKTTKAAEGPGAVGRGSAFGLAKTHDIVFCFHRGNYNSSGVKETLKGLCSDTQVIAHPRWIAATRVLGKVWPYDARLAPGEEFLSRLFDWANRQIENFGWYGMIDFGDTLSWYRQEAYDKSYDDWGWHPEGRWGWFNCEAAGTHTGALMQFLRTGDYKYFRFGVNLTRHIMDIDTCHYNTIANDNRLKNVIFDDYSQPGSMHRHNGNHWGGRNEETAHTNVAGLMLYYQITGDERAREVINEVGNFFLNERYTYFRHPDIAPQRSIANILWGDVLLYELTQDEKYKKAADKLANLFYIGQKSNGAWAENYNPVKDRWEGEPDAGYMRGYTIPALIEYHKLTGNKAIAECIIKVTDFTLAEEYNPYFDAVAYSYWLTGNRKYSEAIKQKVDFIIAHQKKNNDPVWDGMIYQKAYYARVEEFLYRTPFAFEVLADETLINKK